MSGAPRDVDIITHDTYWGIDPVGGRPECRGGYLGREVPRILNAEEGSDEPTETEEDNS